MSVLRRTFFACLLAVAGLCDEGAYTANRMPGTNVLWTAARTSNEVERVRSLVETNAVTRAGTNGWEVGSHAGLATTGALAAAVGGLAGTQALEVAVAPLRVPRRWYDAADSNRWAEYTGGGTVVEYQITNSYSIVVSPDLSWNALYFPPYVSNALPSSAVAYPLTWIAATSDGYNFYLAADDEGVPNYGRWDGVASNGFPVVLFPNLETSPSSVGTATVFRVALTNEIERYYLPTNAIPPELTDLDLLTAWLNSQYYTKAQNDARYLSSVPGWFWQGAQIIATTNAVVTNLTGYAAMTNGALALIPYVTSRHDVTGTVTLVSERYIVGVSALVSLSPSDVPQIPKTPVDFSGWLRVNATTFVARASISAEPFNANAYYWCYLSNIVVQTYDREDMLPSAYTNDAAGIVTRVDSLPMSNGVPQTANGTARQAVNAESMRMYMDSRKTEFADAAWNRTPSGRPSPSAYTVTIDEPLIQQGQISYLNSGDYYCMTYEGGDWYSSTTGSVWRIGPSGRVAFEIASTNRMLYVQAFSVAGGYATLDIATNWVTGTPVIEFTDSLLNPQWLTCPAQTMSNAASFWRGVCPGVATQRFFRAVDPSGDNVIRSYHKHEFLGGLRIGTNEFSTLSELKALLEALP